MNLPTRLQFLSLDHRADTISMKDVQTGTNIATQEPDVLETLFRPGDLVNLVQGNDSTVGKIYYLDFRKRRMVLCPIYTNIPFTENKEGVELFDGSTETVKVYGYRFGSTDTKLFTELLPGYKLIEMKQCDIAVLAELNNQDLANLGKITVVETRLDETIVGVYCGIFGGELQFREARIRNKGDNDDAEKVTNYSINQELLVTVPRPLTNKELRKFRERLRGTTESAYLSSVTL